MPSRRKRIAKGSFLPQCENVFPFSLLEPESALLPGYFRLLAVANPLTDVKQTQLR